MFAKKKQAKKPKGILIALKINEGIVKEKEQRRQALQEVMLTASTLAERKDAKKELLGSANVHMGNKVTKPTYLWNPEGKKQAMTKAK